MHSQLATRILLQLYSHDQQLLLAAHVHKGQGLLKLSTWLYDTRDRPIMLIFYLLCYAAVLKIMTYHAHVTELCLKSDCSIRVYSLPIKNVACSIRVIASMMSVLLEYILIFNQTPPTSYYAGIIYA